MIRLHHAHQTRSMRSLWLLHELGVDFELAVRPFDGSLRSEAYLALNPAGRVPALEIDGACMFETGAIAEYLCERFPEAGLGRLPGDAERMEWLVWLHFAETITQHVAILTQQHVMLYEDHMRSPTLMRLEAKRLAKAYGALEGQLNGPEGLRGTLLASGFSVCDICCGQAVYAGQHYATLEGYPAVQAWYKRITARPAFRKSLPPEGEGIYAQPFYPAPEKPAKPG